MPRRRPRASTLALEIALLLASASAAAAPPPPVAPPGASPPPAASPAADTTLTDKKAQARVHFERGRALARDSAWAAALAEFLESKQIYPTWSATSWAATCLEQLQRFDEAIDMLQALLREFAHTLPEDVKKAAQRRVIELGERFGELIIEEAEPGAVVFIDGNSRGDTSSLAPLRLAVGSHLVRVYKAGFEPFETRVEVAGKQTARVKARLRVLARSGRLRVAEQTGKALSVVVDGSEVGRTPWEGPLAVGDHVIVLRGDGDLGSPPVSAPVQQSQLTSLTLAAEELTASLRVEPTPLSASVAIDAVSVGRGIWEGRLRVGEHTIEAASTGFEPAARQVNLTRGAREVVSLRLQRDASSPFWHRAPRFFLELGGAPVLGLTLGGEISRGCTNPGNVGGQGMPPPSNNPCKQGRVVGGYGVLRGGFQLASGLNFGVAAGYLAAEQSMLGRIASMQISGMPPQNNQGSLDDTIALNSLLTGAFLGFSVGEKFTFHLRLNAGALFGQVSDRRSGTFTASDQSHYTLRPVSETDPATFVYIRPEVRGGLRLGRHIEVSIGFELPIFIGMSQPKWDLNHRLPAGTDGFGSFPPEDLVGGLFVLFAPGAGVRYNF